MLESVYLKALLGVVIGAAAGIGYSRLTRCSTGTCPLTSNWWLAGLYGAALGLFITVSSVGASAAPGTAGGKGAPATQGTPASQPVAAGSQPRQGAKTMAKHADSAEQFDREVLQSSKPVLVDFYATWCGPCRFLTPIMDQISTELADKVDVVKVDVDKAMDLAARYRIQGVPTVILFDDGKPVKSFVGVRSKADYVAAVEQTAGSK